MEPNKSRKYRDIDSDEKRRDWDEVSAGASQVGSSGWDEDVQLVIDVDLGECTHCKHVRAYKTRYGTKKAWCYNFDFVLNPSDPIVECTSFSKRGEMDLDEMKSIAWRIEPAPDVEIGFHPPKGEDSE